jgi:hypothetical protein
MKRALVLSLGLVACGGGSKHAYAPDAPHAEYAHPGYAAADHYSGGQSQTASAPRDAEARAPQAADASRSRNYEDAPSAQAPAPQTRPGLGTEWGEARESHVYETSFTRASSDPFALVSLYYNDRRGIDALSAYHRDHRSARGGVDNEWVSVRVRDENNDLYESYRFGDRNYVVGQAGERYSIVLSNRTGHRIEAVTTVDGLDVINGATGSTRNRGYILMPYATVEIDGFRRSEHEVAAFRFGAVQDSYAAERGSTRNVGVIGVALFEERGDRIDRRELELRDNARPFPNNDRRFAPPPR